MGATTRDSSLSSRTECSMNDDALKDAEPGKELQIAVGDKLAINQPYFPEGGARAYCVVLGGFMALFATFGVSNSYGVLQDQWTLGSFSLAFSTQYYQFMLSYSVCCGLGLGSLFSPTMSCVGSYFLKKRATMVGLAAAGAAAGAVSTPLILNNMFESVGFQKAVLTISGLSAGLLIVANAIMRPREMVRTSGGPATFELFKLFAKQPMSWLTYLGVALSMGGGMFITLFFVQQHAAEYGVSPTLVKSNIAILNGVGTVSRFLAGFIADRCGVFNTAIPISLTLGVTTFALLGAKNTAGAICWDIVYGLAFGSWVTVMSPMWMSLARDSSELGTRVGVGSIFVAIAALVSAPIAGIILTAADGQYWAAMTFGGVVGLTGTMLLVVARFVQARRKQVWKV
ncbi:hypothetical protein OIV83_002940 [Microbotryomycetes sp. JL201]|nr:hypothetical protein OIV83_002940 [Microbotryomycetes sp. JL201]